MRVLTALLLALLPIVSMAQEQPVSSGYLSLAQINLARRCGVAAWVTAEAATRFPKDKESRMRLISKIMKRNEAEKGPNAAVLPSKVEMASAFAAMETLLEIQGVSISDSRNRDVIVGSAAAMCAINTSSSP